MISKNRVLYTFKINQTVMTIRCGFLPYLINRIIRTEVLNGFANTIVNQNGFQVRGELSDQHQNLVLFYRSNHLKEVGQKIGLLWHNGVQKTVFHYLHISKDISYSITSGTNHWIHSSGFWCQSRRFFRNICTLCQPPISNLMEAT